MATASDFRDYALPFLGLQSVDHLSAPASSALMNAFNKALQEIFRRQLQETVGLQVYGPQTVLLEQVTQGLKNLTFQGFLPWMAGCTIVIPGDGTTASQGLQNALEKSGTNPSLRNPYQGPTQTNVTATVYHDAVNLGPEVAELFPPVKLNNQYYVEPLASLRELEASRTVWRDEYNSVPKIIRRPQWFSIEDKLIYQTTPGLRILFDSLPDTSYVLNFEARIAAPRITSWDDERSYFIPTQEDESILFPWALNKFLIYPQFISDSNVRASIAADFQSAQLAWNNRTRGFTHTAVAMD